MEKFTFFIDLNLFTQVAHGMKWYTWYLSLSLYDCVCLCVFLIHNYIEKVVDDIIPMKLKILFDNTLSPVKSHVFFYHRKNLFLDKSVHIICKCRYYVYNVILDLILSNSQSVSRETKWSSPSPQPQTLNHHTNYLVRLIAVSLFSGWSSKEWKID